MKLPAYSSLTAFLAHRRALRELAGRSQEQSALLAEMEAAIAELSGPDRGAMEDAGGSQTTAAQATNTDGERARRRRRAEHHLTHILRQRGILSG